jgi:hypothetical protein
MQSLIFNAPLDHHIHGLVGLAASKTLSVKVHLTRAGLSGICFPHLGAADE